VKHESRAGRGHDYPQPLLTIGSAEREGEGVTKSEKRNVMNQKMRRQAVVAVKLTQKGNVCEKLRLREGRQRGL